MTRASVDSLRAYATRMLACLALVAYTSTCYAASVYQIDIDVADDRVDPPAISPTESGWTSLEALRSDGSGSVSVTDGDGTVTFSMVNTLGARDRNTSEDLTTDFVFNDGDGVRVGMSIDGLPAGTWEVAVYASDTLTPHPADIGYRVGAGPDIIELANESVAWNATGPAATFLMTSDGSSDYEVFVVDDDSAGSTRSRMNAVSLTRVVPEPASLTLVLLALALLPLRRTK